MARSPAASAIAEGGGAGGSVAAALHSSFDAAPIDDGDRGDGDAVVEEDVGVVERRPPPSRSSTRGGGKLRIPASPKRKRAQDRPYYRRPSGGDRDLVPGQRRLPSTASGSGGVLPRPSTVPGTRSWDEYDGNVVRDAARFGGNAVGGGGGGDDGSPASSARKQARKGGQDRGGGGDATALATPSRLAGAPPGTVRKSRRRGSWGRDVPAAGADQPPPTASASSSSSVPFSPSGAALMTPGRTRRQLNQSQQQHQRMHPKPPQVSFARGGLFGDAACGGGGNTGVGLNGVSTTPGAAAGTHAPTPLSDRIGTWHDRSGSGSQSMQQQQQQQQRRQAQMTPMQQRKGVPGRRQRQQQHSQPPDTPFRFSSTTARPNPFASPAPIQTPSRARRRAAAATAPALTPTRLPPPSSATATPGPSFAPVVVVGDDAAAANPVDPSASASSPPATPFRFTTFPASLPRVNNPRETTVAFGGHRPPGGSAPATATRPSVRKRMTFSEESGGGGGGDGGDDENDSGGRRKGVDDDGGGPTLSSASTPRRTGRSPPRRRPLHLSVGDDDDDERAPPPTKEEAQEARDRRGSPAEDVTMRDPGGGGEDDGNNDGAATREGKARPIHTKLFPYDFDDDKEALSPNPLGETIGRTRLNFNSLLSPRSPKLPIPPPPPIDAEDERGKKKEGEERREDIVSSCPDGGDASNRRSATASHDLTRPYDPDRTSSFPSVSSSTPFRDVSAATTGASSVDETATTAASSAAFTPFRFGADGGGRGVGRGVGGVGGSDIGHDVGALTNSEVQFQFHLESSPCSPIPGDPDLDETGEGGEGVGATPAAGSDDDDDDSGRMVLVRGGGGSTAGGRASSRPTLSLTSSPPEDSSGGSRRVLAPKYSNAVVPPGGRDDGLGGGAAATPPGESPDSSALSMSHGSGTSTSTGSKVRKLRPMPDMSAFDVGLSATSVSTSNHEMSGDGGAGFGHHSGLLHGNRSEGSSSAPPADGVGGSRTYHHHPSSSSPKLLCPPTPVRTPAWAHNESIAGPGGAFGRSDSLIATKVLATCPPQVLDGLSSLENSLLEGEESGCSADAEGESTTNHPEQRRRSLTASFSAVVDEEMNAEEEDSAEGGAAIGRGEMLFKPLLEEEEEVAESSPSPDVVDAGRWAKEAPPPRGGGGGLRWNGRSDDGWDGSVPGDDGGGGRPLLRSGGEDEPVAPSASKAPRLSSATKAHGTTSVAGTTTTATSRGGSTTTTTGEVGSVISFESDFVNLGLLGSGAFADVYKARSKADGMLYAVKRNRRQFRGKRDRDRAMAEVRTMQRLQSACAAVDGSRAATAEGSSSSSSSRANPPSSADRLRNAYCLYLLFFIRAWQEGGYFFCQTELCCRDTCRHMRLSLSTQWNIARRRYPSLTRNLPTPLPTESHAMNNHDDEDDTSPGRLIPESTVWKICHDVSAGLSHIHSHGLVHYDIKPSNIFFVPHPRFGAMCKIGDFGMAGDVGAVEDGQEGDTVYMARELLSSGAKRPDADMFSLGLTLYELSSVPEWELPREGVRWHELRNGGHEPELPACRGRNLVNLVKELIDPDKEKRPRADRILETVVEAKDAGTAYDRFLGEYIRDVAEFDDAQERRMAMAQQEANQSRFTPTGPVLSRHSNSAVESILEPSWDVASPTPP